MTEEVAQALAALRELPEFADSDPSDREAKFRP